MLDLNQLLHDRNLNENIDLTIEDQKTKFLYANK